MALDDLVKSTTIRISKLPLAIKHDPVGIAKKNIRTNLVYKFVFSNVRPVLNGKKNKEVI